LGACRGRQCNHLSRQTPARGANVSAPLSRTRIFSAALHSFLYPPRPPNVSSRRVRG